jgi:hypothetical protein
MPDDSLAYRDFHFLGLGLLPDGVLKGDELVFRHRNEEGFEEHDSFPEARIDIVVARINGVPSRRGVAGRALGKARGGQAKVLFEIRYHLLKSVDFVDELQAVGQKDSIEKGVHASGALALGSAEIGRIQGGGVWHGSVMFGMLSQGPEKARKRVSEQSAKVGREAKRIEGSSQAAFQSKTYRLIQRNAEHRVIGFQRLFVSVKNFFFSLRQPGMPVFLDRPSAGCRAADVVSH